MAATLPVPAYTLVTGLPRSSLVRTVNAATDDRSLPS